MTRYSDEVIREMYERAKQKQKRFSGAPRDRLACRVGSCVFSRDVETRRSRFGRRTSVRPDQRAKHREDDGCIPVHHLYACLPEFGHFTEPIRSRNRTGHPGPQGLGLTVLQTHQSLLHLWRWLRGCVRTSSSALSKNPAYKDMDCNYL